MGSFHSDIKFVSPPTRVLNPSTTGTDIALSGDLTVGDDGVFSGGVSVGNTDSPLTGQIKLAASGGAGYLSFYDGSYRDGHIDAATLILDISGAAKGTATATVFSYLNLTTPGAVTAASGTVSGALGVAGALSTSGTVSAAAGTVTAALGVGGTVTAAAAYVGSDPLGIVREQLRAYNLLGNPGFEIWQRGTTFNTIADAAFSADRWQWTKGGTSAANITQETTTVDSNGHYSCKVVYTHNTASNLSQKMEDYYGLRGKVVTFTMRVHCNAASAVRLTISDGVGSTNSSYHTGGSTWETLKVTHTIDAAAGNNVFVIVAFGVSCTAYLDNSTLVVGSVSMDYVPLHPADDLARCQRYYWIQNYVSSFGFGSFVGLYASAGSQGIGPTIYFPQEMMATPTVTKNGTWTVSNCGQPACSGAGKQGFVITGTSSAAGLTYFVPDSSDDTITAVINP